MARLACRFLAFANFFITTTFALPQRKRTRGIRARLVNSTIRRDYFSAATRTEAPARRLFFYIESQWIIVSHSDNASAR